MKKHIKFVIVTLIGTLLFSTNAFALSCEWEKENWYMSYMPEWCWVATGANIGVCLNLDDDDDIGAPGTRIERREYLYELVDMCIEDFDELSANGEVPDYVINNNPELIKYYTHNIGAGLTHTAYVANYLIDELGRDIVYTYTPNVRSFNLIWKDMYGEDCPTGIWLTGGDGEHIVLINGANKTTQELKINDPAQGEVWITYDDLFSGSCEDIGNRVYTSTIFG